MIEMIVEFFIQLLFPLESVVSTAKSAETTVENYTFSSVFLPEKKAQEQT